MTNFTKIIFILCIKFELKNLKILFENWCAIICIKMIK
jgi:hypothetical protein